LTEAIAEMCRCGERFKLKRDYDAGGLVLLWRQQRPVPARILKE
jgi:hypothetical protein